MSVAAATYSLKLTWSGAGFAEDMFCLRLLLSLTAFHFLIQSAEFYRSSARTVKNVGVKTQICNVLLTRILLVEVRL